MYDDLRLDAADSAFFTRDLAAIEAELHRTDFPEIKHAKLIPTVTGYAPGAASDIYRQFTGVGRAKIISDKSKDLPRVDVKGDEVLGPVKPLGDAFAYTVMEVKGAAEAAKKGNPAQPLPRERASWAYEAIQRALEDVAALGDAPTKLKGLCNHDAVSSGTAQNGGGGSSLWIHKTPDEILLDVNSMVETIRDATMGIESPDTLVLPEKQFAHIALTRLTDTGEKTILDFILKNQPFLEGIESWHYLKGAGAAGKDRAVAYRRDPMKLKLKNPHGYQQFEPRRVGLEYIIECFMTTGGVTVYKPKSIHYLDNI
jgi:hypothetical protein